MKSRKQISHLTQLVCLYDVAFTNEILDDKNTKLNGELRR